MARYSSSPILAGNIRKCYPVLNFKQILSTVIVHTNRTARRTDLLRMSSKICVSSLDAPPRCCIYVFNRWCIPSSLKRMYKNHCSYSPISTKCPLASLHVLFPKVRMCACVCIWSGHCIYHISSNLALDKEDIWNVEMNEWNNPQDQTFLKTKYKQMLSLSRAHQYIQTYSVYTKIWFQIYYVCLYVCISQPVSWFLLAF